MDAGTRLVIERQAALDGAWDRVAGCNSLEYARMIATAGLRKRMAVAYRVVHARTGKSFVLQPRASAAAGA